MSIRVLFFASVRERLGCDGLELDAVPGGETVAAVRARLAARGGPWAEVLGEQARVLAALNQQMVAPHFTVDDGDELAFFPPVTGG